eukprot:g1835.t1
MVAPPDTGPGCGLRGLLPAPGPIPPGATWQEFSRSVALSHQKVLDGSQSEDAHRLAFGVSPKQLYLPPAGGAGPRDENETFKFFAHDEPARIESCWAEFDRVSGQSISHAQANNEDPWASPRYVRPAPVEVDRAEEVEGAQECCTVGASFGVRNEDNYIYDLVLVAPEQKIEIMEQVQFVFVHVNRPTRLCTFATTGRCPNAGRECPYAHSTAELRQQPDLRKTSLCTAFAKGECPYLAEHCWFAHGVEERRIDLSVWKTKPCTFFQNRGYCKWGDKCSHLHVRADRVRGSPAGAVAPDDRGRRLHLNTI